MSSRHLGVLPVSTAVREAITENSISPFSQFAPYDCVISLAICWIITSVTSLRGSTRRLTSRRRPGQYGLTGIKMAGAASARPHLAAYIILTPGVILE